MTPDGFDLVQYRTQAKELLKQARSGSEEALTRIRSSHPEGNLLLSSPRLQLSDTQLVIARECGYPSWAKFKEYVLLKKAIQCLDSGDVDALSALIKQHPAIVKYRIGAGDYAYFDHATLLHHIASNPIRCPLPRNVIEIATILLDRGADPNAICGVPGNTSSTIGLLLTSKQASEAGMALPLIDLLIKAGAKDSEVTDPDVLSLPLWNVGRQTAEALVRRGVKMDLRHAAALGRIDVMQDLSTNTELTLNILEEALVYAAAQKEVEAVRWLVERDAIGDVITLGDRRGSALHNAAANGNAEIVQLLLDNGVRTDIRDNMWSGLPADWAEYAGQNEIAAILREPRV